MTDQRTNELNSAADEAEKGVESSLPAMLPFALDELVSMRLNQSQFAKAVGVSKQAVSDWVKNGVVTLGADGLLDPVRASREVFEKTDPARLRARIFKTLARDSHQLIAQNRELRDQVRILSADCEQLRAGLEAATRHRMHSDEIADRLSAYQAAILENLLDLAVSEDPESWLDRLEAVHFYQLSVEELTELFGDCPSHSERI